jgi:hypothetical protein
VHGIFVERWYISTGGPQEFIVFGQACILAVRLPARVTIRDRRDAVSLVRWPSKATA